MVYGLLIKAFKVEKRLISTLLPLRVGALIVHEQIKWNYLSRGEEADVNALNVEEASFRLGITKKFFKRRVVRP